MNKHPTSLHPFQPTPYPDVNFVLNELRPNIQSILSDHLIGMYLDGSLASGAFDQDSDIDFVVVTDQEVSDELFLALRAMHERISALDSPFATELEGTYISQAALRRYDPNHSKHPRIQRGKHERLEIVQHDDDWLVHLAILRERGITLLGPAPQTLVDPVSPNALRRAMLKRLNGWAVQILDNPAIIHTRGYQSYTVLSICRILYTLEFGTVVSKRSAATWAQDNLEKRWTPLIERTWASRHNPGQAAPVQEINETIEFIRFALKRSAQFKISGDKN